jgi:RND family efflux transporter MFP subunit
VVLAALVGLVLAGTRSDSEAQTANPAPTGQPIPVPAGDAATQRAYAANAPTALHEFEFPELLEPRQKSPSETSEFADVLDCLIEPYQMVDIGSPVIGLIESVHVDRSDQVEKGQPLAELESAVERATLELARARAEMDGQERAREASVALGRSKETRARLLYEKSVVSLDLREEAETAARVARLELQQAQEERRLASLQLAQAEEVLRRRTIRSPVSGVVVERLMAPGERVDEEVIMRVAQIDPLRVEVTLPASRFGTVRPGMRAAIEAEVPSDQVFVASVSVVDPLVDAASGTFGIRLDLPNPDHTIPSGLHCRVRFIEP